MKKYIIIILLLFSTNIFFSQNVENLEEYFSKNNSYIENEFPNEDFEKKFSEKPEINFEIGSNFSSNFGGGNTFSTFIAPNISYNINPKLKINVGMKLTRSTFNDFQVYNFSENSFGDLNGDLNSALFYTSVNYEVNEKLKVSAMVFYEKNNFENFENVHPNAFNFISGKGASFGFEYKINENMKIGGEFQYSEGRNPFNYNNNYNSPFTNSSFNNHLFGF